MSCCTAPMTHPHNPIGEPQPVSTNPDNTDGELLTAVTGVTGGTIVDSSPEPAQILTSLVDSRIRYAVAVTEQHGLQVNELDDTHLAPHPRRPAGVRTVADIDSLLAELDRRPLDPAASTVWGDQHAGTVTVIYNDHAALPGPAGWRDDRLVLALKADRDWSAWHAISGKWFGQSEFGDVIEDLLHTITDPDQADLLEIIDTIRASSSASFESPVDVGPLAIAGWAPRGRVRAPLPRAAGISINRHDGSQTLGYTEEVKASAGRSSGRLEVPQTLTLALRPWEGHVETYDVPAYFRLRVQGGALALAVKLKPTEQIVRAAWLDVTSKVVAATGVPVLAHRG